MTGNELQNLFEFLVDDSISDDDFLVIINIAANKLWVSSQQYEFLKTNTDSVSTTPNLTTYNLPNDFLLPLPIWIGDTQIKPINRKDRRLYRNSHFRYYLDLKNNKFVLTYFPTSSEVIYFDYIYQPLAIELSDDEIGDRISGFKKAFHPILAYEAAKVYYQQDAGSKNDSWDREHQIEYNRLLNAMNDYDHALKIASQDSAIRDINLPSNQPNVIDELD